MEVAKEELLTETDWVEVFEVWLEGKASAHTRAAYRSAWKLLLLQAQKMPWELEQDDLLKWVKVMQRQGASNKSIQLRLSAIRSFFAEMERWGENNPASGISMQTDKKNKGLTQAEVDAFLGAIPTNTLNGKRDYALFLCYLTSGRRPGEVKKLKQKQILQDGKRAWLVWGQAEQRRRERMTEGLWQALERYLSECGVHSRGPEDYVFTAWRGGQATGKPLSTTWVCHLVKQYARRAGLSPEITVQTLRQTAAEQRMKAFEHHP